jgi:hypothetical protein
VGASADARCNQENPNAKRQGDVRSQRAPVDNLTGNWACMVTTSLAWSTTAWFDLLLPTKGRWRGRNCAEQQERLDLPALYREALARRG